MINFSEVPLDTKNIEGLQLMIGFRTDTFKNKVDAGIAGYRNEEGKPWVLPVVREVEKALAADDTLDKEYLPILGLQSFTNAATVFVLGKDSPALREKRAFGVQCVSGSGALRVAAEFLVKVLARKIFYYSKPTWAHHIFFFNCGGFEEGRGYCYWSDITQNLDFDGLIKDLSVAPKYSVVILQACAHNDTGCDPTQEQWEKIADVVEERELFPVFDTAFQGFASGDPDKDAWSVRYFVSRGIELLCAQSFSKNFGLYSERVGNLVFVLKDSSYLLQVKSQITRIVFGMYLTPPRYGAHIVSNILNNQNLYKQWLEHLQAMISRILTMRKALREAVEELGTPGDWSKITSQTGMFVFTGFNERQAEHMIKKHHVYMHLSGRMNICGVNSGNVKYVAQALYDTVTNIK